MCDDDNPDGRWRERPALNILEIETFGRGGLTHYVYNLSRALAARGHRVHFVTTAAYELDGAPMPPGVTVERLIGRAASDTEPAAAGLRLSAARKLEAIHDAFAVAARAHRLRPDVIHLHCTGPIAALHLLLLRRLGIPVAYTAHVVTPHEPIPLQRRVYRTINVGNDLVIAHSSVDRERLVEEFGATRERTIVIPHGEYGFFERIDELPDRGAARQRLRLSADEEVVLFFGYIREYKGLDVLLDAWTEVRDRRPAARLVIAGDPVRLDARRRVRLEARARDLGALCHFDYVPVDEVAAYFAAADVLAMPYRRISHSGVLYLGLALGVPLVATSVGPIPELLADGDNALLVPPEAPAELATALVRVLGDRRLGARLAEGGRRLAAEHSWETIAQRTEIAFARLSRA